MHTDEIQKAMDDLRSQMSGKEFAQPRAQFQIESDRTQFNVFLWWNPELVNDPYKNELTSLKGDTPADAIKAAGDWISKHPTKKQRLTEQAAKALAHAIEQCDKAGMDVNPIVEALKAVTGMQLTYQPKLADADDDMPF